MTPYTILLATFTVVSAVSVNINDKIDTILEVFLFFEKATHFQDIVLKMSLSVTSHTNCIVARWPDKRCLSHGMCLYQDTLTLHFQNDVVNDFESTKNSIMTS